MESENRVNVEEESRVIQVIREENLNKEDHKECNGTEIQTQNEASEPTAEIDEGLKSAGAGVAVEASVTSSASKTSKRAKVMHRM